MLGFGLCVGPVQTNRLKFFMQELRNLQTDKQQYATKSSTSRVHILYNILYWIIGKFHFLDFIFIYFQSLLFNVYFQQKLISQTYQASQKEHQLH